MEQQGRATSVSPVTPALSSALTESTPPTVVQTLLIAAQASDAAHATEGTRASDAAPSSLAPPPTPAVVPCADGVHPDRLAELSSVADEALLQRYVAGDASAFALLVARYQRELYHFLARFLGDRVVAEDIFQEAFLQVHESGATFDPARRFRPWLFTIAANKARDYLRSKHRHPTAPLDAPINGDAEQHSYVDLLAAASEVPDEPLAREELRAAVKRTIDEMPPHLREVLLLGHFHEFSYKQIADMLHVPLGTVKSRLHAAVGHFARSWQRHKVEQERKEQDRADARADDPDE